MFHALISQLLTPTQALTGGGGRALVDLRHHMHLVYCAYGEGWLFPHLHIAHLTRE